MVPRRAALQLVESNPFQEEVALPGDTSGAAGHSLHGLFPSSVGVIPEATRMVVERFSKRGETILDPFAGLGTVVFEAAVRGRRVFGLDRDPLACRIAEARLNPADLAEVALALQFVNLKRPMDLSAYTLDFGLYYDVDTFCELMNLRQAIADKKDRVYRFIESALLAILHGHTTSYLSVYSSPRAAVTPQAQAQLNRKRAQVPDYRSVSPRLLKKAAFLLRDGVPGAFNQPGGSGRVVTGDPRDMTNVPTASLPLVVTAPPTPVSSGPAELDSWLRRWFTGMPAVRAQQDVGTSRATWEGWRGYMNEVLLETARVVRSGGRSAFILDDTEPGRRCQSVAQELCSVGTQDLGKFWALEGTLSVRAGQKDSEMAVKSPRRSGDFSHCEVVVLRRR